MSPFHRLACFFSASAAVLMGTSSAAWAQAPGGGVGAVGISATSRPDYTGSPNRELSLRPSLNYQWANGWFAGTERGVGYSFGVNPAGPSPAAQYGVLLGADLGRKASDSDKLAGMGDVDVRPEVGGFVSYALTAPLRLTSTLRYGSGNSSDGALLNFNAAYSTEIAPGWRASLNASTSLANASYMQSYFGVSQTQSGSSGYAVYAPSGGFKDVSGGLTLSYQLNPRTSISTGLTASALLGDARSSPLTQKPNSISGTLGVRYGF